MTREEAIAIARSTPELIVEVLLQMSARIAEFERMVALLTRDSSNSSKPPSSDGPAAKPKARRPMKSKKRKPGGQPGHKGKKRELIAADRVDVIEEIVPEKCCSCGEALSNNHNPGGKYLRYQMTDIPKVTPHVTEYRVRCLTCRCGIDTWAELPDHARSGFGPNLTAFAAYLTAVQRVPRRGVVDIFRTLFGVDISLGSVCSLHQEVSQALEPSYEEIKQTLPGQSFINVDETGWRSMGRPSWLWVFTTPTRALFNIAPSRGSKVIKGILGAVFDGILCSDRYSAYGAYHKGLRQVCWAHIIREIKGIRHSCRSPDAVKYSRWMLSEIGRMFGLFNAFRREQFDRKTLVLKSVPLRARMNRCLRTYEASSDPDVARNARGLLKHWNSLFTFLDYQGIEPTNNAAERAIRSGVQWRKICFGNQSPEGELFTARLLTVIRTCALQGKDLIQYLVTAINAFRTGTHHPSLVLFSR
jgi:transposase